MAASAPVDSVEETETVPSSSMSILVPVSSWMDADHLPARANDCSDLLRIDLESNHSWRELGQLFSRLVNRLRHLAKNEEPAVSGLGQRFAHDLRRDALDLDVHLDGGHTVCGARDLEVHIAERVFHALDIAQNGVLPSLGIGDQSHGDAGDRRLIGTPASMSASVLPQTLAIEVEPFELTTSETSRIV